jgi:hypothetical protein
MLSQEEEGSNCIAIIFQVINSTVIHVLFEKLKEFFIGFNSDGSLSP